jgi:hypothetical protein
MHRIPARCSKFTARTTAPVMGGYPPRVSICATVSYRTSWKPTVSMIQILTDGAKTDCKSPIPHSFCVLRDWPSVMFDRLWAEGGIVVSARREKGRTQFVQLCNRGDMLGKVQLDTDTALVCSPAQMQSDQSHKTSSLLGALPVRERTVVNVTVRNGNCIVCHQPGMPKAFRIDSADMPGYSADYHYFGQR